MKIIQIHLHSESTVYRSLFPLTSGHHCPVGGLSPRVGHDNESSGVPSRFKRNTCTLGPYFRYYDHYRDPGIAAMIQGSKMASGEFVMSTLPTSSPPGVTGNFRLFVTCDSRISSKRELHASPNLPDVLKFRSSINLGDVGNQSDSVGDKRITPCGGSSRSLRIFGSWANRL
jgi:hypothetical protein